ncbi:MAG TPA: hypothetical protein VN408_24515 [Actinoplanes sp.]|nr:hypothetical protein [Actinoplanes sp.]
MEQVTDLDGHVEVVTGQLQQGAGLVQDREAVFAAVESAAAQQPPCPAGQAR